MATWLEDAVFYQIYPQSFCDSNGDGIGDLPGLAGKLDYLVDLGVTALWINPCFDSPFGDGGYDVRNYRKVAPRYGTNQDLVDLFAAAHRRGLRVILDLVPGHTAIDHPWFVQSAQAGQNEMSKRYVWTDSVWTSPDPMPCLRGVFPRDASVAVNFFSNQPALNYGFWQPDPEKPWQEAMDAPGPMATRLAMVEVMDFWLNLGCDGFRVDMAASLVKHDPEGLGNIALWQKVRSWLDESWPEAVLVSEWGEADKALKAGFHMDFLLHFGPSRYNELFRCQDPWFSGREGGRIDGFLERYLANLAASTSGRGEPEGLICFPTGNHDMDRLARHLDAKGRILAFGFILTMPGVPFIYYGDEIGMGYVEGLDSVEGGYGRTGSRSPMQWRPGPGAGFTAAAPEACYIPLDPSPDRPDVASSQADPASLWHQVRQLLALRRRCVALQASAGVEFLSRQAPLVYRRTAQDRAIWVLVNPKNQALHLPAGVLKTGSLRGQALWSHGWNLAMPGLELTPQASLPPRSILVLQES